MAEVAPTESAAEVEIVLETKRLKRGLTLLPLTGIIYFTVCGGTFGIEPLIGGSGPGLSILLILVTPLIFSVPLILMVREMQSMMPVEGGYYHWIKQAFGPFAGFLAGWMNLVVSWLDASIYPVLAAAYLAYFFPVLDSGITIGGIEIPGTTTSFVLGLVLIWGITALQIRGARLTGLTTNWIGLAILIPIALLAIIGIWNWIQAPPAGLPFIPEGTELTGAFSLGLFVVMWNYMGFELATVAGDEIVNPKRTYPLAMGIVLVLAIATYLLPVTAGLYGGAGADGRYLLWGAEATDDATIGTMMTDSGIDEATLQSWGVDPAATSGWYLPDIAKAVGDKTAGEQDSGLGGFLGGLMTIAAALAMVGLFIGNSLGASRIPFALSEDGMMPTWLVRVSPRYGTPWVAIVVAGVLYSIFASNAFAFLVVADVLLNMLVIVACFFALWRLRFSRPDEPRKKIPGGYLGLGLATLGPIFITVVAVYSQWVDVGSDSITLAIGAMIVGALLYFPIRRFVKPGIPDIDPYQTGTHSI
jgi:amino acid transporter